MVTTLLAQLQVQGLMSLVSDIPSDLVIKIYDTTYLLHKSSLLPKCGLLRRLCLDSSDSENVPLELHDMPGGADAFEICAKFCYGVSINISAHNFVPALCAAKLLQMNESIEKGNTLYMPKYSHPSKLVFSPLQVLQLVFSTYAGSSLGILTFASSQLAPRVHDPCTRPWPREGVDSLHQEDIKGGYAEEVAPVLAIGAGPYGGVVVEDMLL
ncbi:hypothetical protein JHK87_042383 [Glycine soja]|nr:hypothetical protein JHK87_042383 [Glycine soja]